MVGPRHARNLRAAEIFLHRHEMFPGLQSWKTWPVVTRRPKHFLNPGSSWIEHIWGMKKWHLWGSPWLTMAHLRKYFNLGMERFRVFRVRRHVAWIPLMLALAWTSFGMILWRGDSTIVRTERQQGRDLLEDLGVIVSIARMDNSKTQAMNFGAACTGMHLLSISVIWHISYMIVTTVLSQKHGMPQNRHFNYIGMF